MCEGRRDGPSGSTEGALGSSAEPSEVLVGFATGGIECLFWKSPSPWLVTDFSSQERLRSQGSKHSGPGSAAFLRLATGLVLLLCLLLLLLLSHPSPIQTTQLLPG